jgi:Glycosyl transferase family 2
VGHRLAQRWRVVRLRERGAIKRGRWWLRSLPRRVARAWASDDLSSLVRRHVGMGLDEAWVLGRHYVRRPFGRREPRDVVPLDGSARFALVVVNFSTTRFLKLLLLTLAEQRGLGLVHRIVVVDNGSVDGGLQFLRRLATRSVRVELVERHHLFHHARALRAGVARLQAIDCGADAPDRCNVYLFCDPDVIFRSGGALQALSARIVDSNAALAGEWRGDPDDPDIQASFVAGAH